MTADILSDEALDKVLARFEALEGVMREGGHGAAYVAQAREHASLRELAQQARALRALRESLRETQEMSDGADMEMAALAREELESLQGRVRALEAHLLSLLVEQDGDDRRNIILEVRPGAGGDEAALFAGDLFRMYQRYASLRGWTVEIMGTSATVGGGYKEAIAAIKGEGVFGQMKFESGVHRVQRIPVTESGGRIHTSTATVAVLAEPDPLEVTLDEKDVRIDVFRARGPGGQSVNTTDSAVRVTHLPSGIVVSQQDEKSQHRNKAKALQILRARLYERERLRRQQEEAQTRRSQVGTGDRSERIRTYNFPQSRVTDHRIGLTLHKLEKFLQGEALQEMVDALASQARVAQAAGKQG